MPAGWVSRPRGVRQRGLACVPWTELTNASTPAASTRAAATILQSAPSEVSGATSWEARTGLGQRTVTASRKKRGCGGGVGLPMNPGFRAAAGSPGGGEPLPGATCADTRAPTSPRAHPQASEQKPTALSRQATGAWASWRLLANKTKGTNCVFLLDQGRNPPQSIAACISAISGDETLARRSPIAVLEVTTPAHNTHKKMY